MIRYLLILLFSCLFFYSKAQLEKPEIIIGQTEMTAVGGQVYDEFYWLNTAGANLTKTGVSFAGGTYRFDLSAYAVAGAAQVGMYIDGILKGTITVNTALNVINIFSLPTLSISAGTHTVKIQINNFSGSIHSRVGLLYFTQTALTVPYVYPALTAKTLPAAGQYLTKEDFGGGKLRGFNLGSNNISANDATAMKTTGADIARAFVEGQFTGDVFSLKSGEQTKLDSAVARAGQRSYYLVPVLFLDPSFNSVIWGTSAAAIAKRASIVSMWSFLANRYKLNTWVGAYDLWNEPRSNFNYAEVIRWQTDMVDAIRAVDANHVVAFECIKNDQWAMMLPLGYAGIIYSPHGYSTTKITHQGVDYYLGVSPPGDTIRNKYSTTTSTINLTAPWGITQLSAQHDDVRIMTNRFHVPVFIGEFSCINWAPLNNSSEWTSTKWVNDNITLLEAENWSWAYHAWREFEGWDAEIPSSYYTSFTYTKAAPFNHNTKPGGWASQRTSAAPTITMLRGWFNLSTANTYYVSSSTGNDLTGTGTQALPYATIAKANSLNPAAGAVIYLKRGDTFNETITPSTSGTALLPIIYDAYGTGANPVITRMTSVVTWTNLGGNIWESAAITTSITPDIVTVNGNIVGKGRYPNDDAANGGYLNIDAVTGQTAVTVLSLPSTNNYTGAELVMRTSHWQLDRNFISNHDAASHIITYTGSSGRTPPRLFGIFIQNSPLTLDKPNEWYFNPTTKKLRIYSTTSPVNIQIATASNLATTSSKNYITFNNIAFNGCNSDAISLTSGTGITVQNCTFNNVGRSGLQISGHKRLLFQNNTVKNCMDGGLRILNSSFHAEIYSNVIDSISLVRGLQQTGSNHGNGIFSDATADTLRIAGNTITDIGYSGINFRNSDSLYIVNNNIQRYNITTDDGAGIYGYGNTVGTNWGRVIKNNIIRDAVGAPLGTTASGAFLSSSYGAYWDAALGNLDADSNHFHNTGRAGSFYHYDVHDVNMRGNTFDSCQYLLYIVRNDVSDIINNSFKGNILFTRSTQKAIYFDNFDNTLRATFGSIDSNYIAHQNTNTTPFTIHSTNGTTSYSFINWKGIVGFDTHSDTFQTVSTSTIREDYSTANDNTLNLGGYNWLDAKHTFYPKGTYVLNPYKGSVLVRWNLVGLTPPTITLSYTGSTITPGNLTFNASVADQDGAVTQVEFFNGATLINTDVSSPFSYNLTGLTAGTYTFTAKATDNDGLTTTSAPVTVTISNPLPVVNITSPPTGQTYTAPASITIAVTANIATGSITKINYYSNNVFIGTSNIVPYSFTWNSVPVGTYSLTAVAVSSYGDSTRSPAISITVNGANIPPTVSLTSPTAGSSTNTNYTLTAIASDADGTIVNVKFYDNGVLLVTDNSSPYTTNQTFSVGSHSITAVATDNNGATATSVPVVVTVLAPNVFPTVSITSPVSGTSYDEPASFTITGTASDADGTITNTKLYQDGILVGSDNTAPYSFNITGLPAGGYNFILRAFDNSGDSTSSASINVVVVVPVPVDTTNTLELTATIVNPILCNGGSALVRIAATGGEPPYAGAVGDHTETAGLKTYIVTDDAGNADTLVININEPGALSATATVGTILVYGGSTNAIINPIGGTGPFTYSLNGQFPQSSNTYKVFAGSYTVSVTDANGCSTTVSFTVSQPSPGNDKIIHGRRHKYINL